MVKCEKNINNFDCILSFDLAKKLTGWSIISIKDFKIIDCGMIDSSKWDEESFWRKYYEAILNVINCHKNYNLFVTKEKCPMQAGRFSTVATLQALAQCHAVFQMAAYDSGIEIYDIDGVHSVSVKAFFKREYGIEKPSKSDIFNALEKLCGNFQEFDVTFDISDSIAVSVVLLKYKYKSDIEDRKKELKREIKNYKSGNKISELQEKITRLDTLLYREENVE